MHIAQRTQTVLLVLILAVGVAIVAMLATGVRGGPLDPAAPPHLPMASASPARRFHRCRTRSASRAATT